jgi:putative PIN family toxin of toxin-antitoxin system
VTRVVIDPSVLVSALIGKPGSAPDIVVRAFIDDRVEVVVSPLLVAELERVLARSKFRRYVDQKSATEYVARIQRHARTTSDPANIPTMTRDPNDDYLVALAQQENADAIISVDLDLLDAGLTDPPTRTPRQLADTLTE